MVSKVTYDVFHLLHWDWKIAMDLFLGGMAVGAFLYAISMMFYRNSGKLPSVRAGAILGPVGMTAGLLFMLSEMGRPSRIYKTLTGFNFTSTLSWGGIVQEGFVVFSLIFAILLFTGRKKTLRHPAGVFAGFFALFAMFYHGFLLSFVTARPLWNNGASGVASVVTSINTGIAATLLLTFFSAKGREEIKEIAPLLKNCLLISLLVQITTFLIWIASLLTGKADFVNAYHVLNENFGLLLWGGALILGLVVPFVTLLVYRRRVSGAVLAFLVSLPILAGGYIFRYVLVIAGQLS